MMDQIIKNIAIENLMAEYDNENQTCNKPQMEFLDCCRQGKGHVPGSIHRNPPSLAVRCADHKVMKTIIGTGKFPHFWGKLS